MVPKAPPPPMWDRSPHYLHTSALRMPFSRRPPLARPSAGLSVSRQLSGVWLGFRGEEG